MHQLLHHCVFQMHPFKNEKRNETIMCYGTVFNPLFLFLPLISCSQFNLLLRRMDQSEKPLNNWGRKSALEIILSSLIAQSRLKQRKFFRAVSSWVFSISKMETQRCPFTVSETSHSKSIWEASWILVPCCYSSPADIKVCNFVQEKCWFA